MPDKEAGVFVWSEEKESINFEKHGINFTTASEAFKDRYRKIYVDSKHTHTEERFFCIGKLKSGKVITVRFVYREEKIRIIGAGFWRKGKVYYEKKD